MQDILPLLGRFPPDCRPRSVKPLGAAGGMSGAQFWQIAAPRGFLILRRWPTEHPTPDRLRFIHAVLDHAAGRDIQFLPVPIRATSGESFVEQGGHLWELAPWLSGTANYEHAPSIEKLQAAMRSLAKLHIAVADFDWISQPQVSVGRQSDSGPTTAVIYPLTPPSDSPTITRRLAMLHELESGGTHQLARAITDTTWLDLAPLARQFLAALPAAIPRAIAQLSPLANLRFTLQPCLRDIWHDHVLFTGNEVTGIVDFGAMDIDTPACDLARLLGSLGTVPFSPAQVDDTQFAIDEFQGETAKRGLSPSPQDEPQSWQTALAAYSSIRPLSPDEVHAVTALDTSGTVLAGCNWIRWIYIDGRQFENPTQVTQRFRRIVARLERIRADSTSL